MVREFSVIDFIRNGGIVMMALNSMFDVEIQSSQYLHHATKKHENEPSCVLHSNFNTREFK